MKKSYNSLAKKANFYFYMQEFVQANKYKIILISVLCLIGILTGIFTAVKISGTDDLDLFEAFNLTKSLSEFENFSNNFFSRLFSYEVVLVLLLIFAQHPAVNVFGYCLITYRGFLIAINCTMLIIVFSFSGILKSLLIILPCQLLMLAVMAIYFCFACNQTRTRKVYCKNKKQGIVLQFVIATVALSLVNLVETILLFVFKSSVILVV